MSRTDAKQLNVPEVPSEPKKSENPKDADKPESQMDSLLESMGKTPTHQVQSNKCPSCKGSLSGIEQKMGRCLTCGKTIEDPNTDQDSSPKPTPKFEVRI